MRRMRVIGLVAAMGVAGWLAAGLSAAPAKEKGKAKVKKPATPAAALKLEKIGIGAPDAEKLGWRLGFQSYTFRRYTFFEAIDASAALGLNVIEVYSKQKVSKDINEQTNPSMSEATVKAIQAKLASAGVKWTNYGVTKIPATEPEAREFFLWCKQFGIETIVSETNHPFLDKLCEELKMNVAFHNHPSSWPPDKVLAETKGRTRRIGACADNGHWMRANLNPLNTLKKLEGRIVSMHFKDLNEFGSGHSVPFGTGKGDVKAQLVELHRQGFKGVFSIEYEYAFTMEDLAACVKYFNDCAKEIAAGK